MQFSSAYIFLYLKNNSNRLGNTEPELHLKVSSNSTTLLDLDFTKHTDQHVRKEIFYEDVPDLNDIHFSATGTGEASVCFFFSLFQYLNRTKELYIYWRVAYLSVLILLIDKN